MSPVALFIASSVHRSGLQVAIHQLILSGNSCIDKRRSVTITYLPLSSVLEYSICNCHNTTCGNPRSLTFFYSVNSDFCFWQMCGAVFVANWPSDMFILDRLLQQMYTFYISAYGRVSFACQIKDVTATSQVPSFLQRSHRLLVSLLLKSLDWSWQSACLTTNVVVEIVDMQ